MVQEPEEMTESIDRNPIISVYKSVQETVENMTETQRTMFAGVLFDYVSVNLDPFSRTNSAINLFEKPREIQADRDMKFKLISVYNKMLDKLVSY